MVLSLIPVENASPLMLHAGSPAASASLWKAAELYQPAVPHLPSAPSFSKKMPIVAAPQPKAAVMRDARP